MCAVGHKDQEKMESYLKKNQEKEDSGCYKKRMSISVSNPSLLLTVPLFQVGGNLAIFCTDFNNSSMKM